jgi:hypothetical protein
LIFDIAALPPVTAREVRLTGIAASAQGTGYFDDLLRERRERSRGFDPLLRGRDRNTANSPTSSLEEVGDV